MSKYCVFSVADDQYAPRAITALLSCRHQEPEMPLFLFGSHFSAATHRLAERRQIRLIELEDQTFRAGRNDYPAECFYWFLAAKILQKNGYIKALYLDGDVYANRPFRHELERDFGDFAGYAEMRIEQLLGDDLAVINRLWPGRKRSPSARGLQSGVVLIDLLRYKANDCEKRIKRLYRDSQQASVPRRGDDSLFMLYQYLTPSAECRDLGPAINYIVRRWPARLRDEQIIFYHFASLIPKPWVRAHSWPWLRPWWYRSWRRFAHFRRAWRRVDRG